jgi:hypothetical protein
MKRKTWLKPTLALAASSLLLGGCVVHETVTAKFRLELKWW